MKRALLAAALPAALVVGLVACGGDDNTATTANTTASATQPTTVRTSETGQGSTNTLPGGITVPDLGSILPGGSLPNLSIPDITVPDLGSLVPNVESVLKKTFPKLTDQQVSCLANHLSGSNVSLSKITSLLDECHIDSRDLIPG